MNNKQISYEAAFNFAFSSFINNIGTFFILWACTFAMGLLCVFLAAAAFIPIILSTIAFPFGWIVLPLTISASAFLLIFTVILFAGFYHYQMVRFSLAIHEGKPLAWSQFFVFQWTPFMPFCLARFVRWLLIILGTILFIVPGFYWACKYYFAGYSLVDGTTTRASEDRSYIRALTKGVRGQIFGFLILIYLLSFLTSLALLFPMPILYLASVHVYKQLKEQETTPLPPA